MSEQGARMTHKLQHEYLKAMGVQRWVARDKAEEIAGDSLPEQTSDGSGPVAQDWLALEAQVSSCKKCQLHKSRTQTVFGTGNRDADWLIIGEAPGADEDRQGEPFGVLPCLFAAADCLDTTTVDSGGWPYCST
jgi:DNA polymerase